MPRARWIVLGTALVLLVPSALEAYRPETRRPGAELVWVTGGIDARPGGSSYDIAAAWNQLHPNGPTVRIEALPNSPNDQHEQMALELADGRRDIDILTLDLVWTGEFAAKGWLADLETIRKRIEDVSLPGAVQSAMWDGKLWASPDTSDAPFLYYRTDLVNHAPRTWDEAVQMGLDVASEHPGMEPFVGEGAQYEGMVVTFLEYLSDAGGTLFDANCTKVGFDDAQALKALQFMRTARVQHFFASTFDAMKEEEARDAFQSGRAVFMRNWPYAYELLKHPGPKDQSAVADRFEIAPLPTFKGKGVTAVLGGHNLAVSQFSDDIPDAMDFVAFVSTTRDIQRRLAEKHSMVPTMTSVYKDLKDHPTMKLLGGILRQATPRPAMPDWNEVSKKIQGLIFPAYNGRSDLRAAVGELHVFLESRIANGRGCG